MSGPGALLRRPKSWGVRVQRFRHVLQLAVAAFIGYVVIQRLIFPESSGVIVASGEAFCPFGGFEGAYRWLTSGGMYLPHTHASNLILALGIVLTAVVAKSFFCGWICPLGALQEAIAAFSHGLQRRVPRLRRAVHALQQRADHFLWVDRWLRYLKYLVLIWALGGAALFGYMVFRDVDPWVAIVNVAELEASLGAVTLAIVLIASLFVERPWCRYACPLGATIGILGRISLLKIERTASACLACGVCNTSCPVGLQVDRMTRVDSPDCISCLQCVGACPSEGGLNVKFALPGVKPTLPATVLVPDMIGTSARGSGLLPPVAAAPSALVRKGKRVPDAVPTHPRWRSWSVKPGVYAALGLVLFFTPVWAAQAAGFWTTSGRLTGAGQIVVPTGSDPAEVRGWMTLDQIVEAYGVSREELYAQFDIPIDTPSTTPLNNLEKVSGSFSTIALRTWLAERQRAAP
jgi:hypothetical protein